MSSAHRYIGALTICFVLTGPAPAAYVSDFDLTYVYVTCDPVEHTVSVVLEHTLSNEETSALEWYGATRPVSEEPAKQTFRVSSQIDYGECLLAHRLPVRIKISEGRSMPYGMCGAIPEVWISIWVDQRKWVSRRQIDGHCTLKPMSRIVISPDELRRCWIKTDALGEPVEKYGEKCRFIPDSRLPQERDYIEYPRSLADRAEPGSIVIELGKENSLCRNMLIERRTRLNRAAWAVDVPAEAKRMAADRVRGQRGLFEYFTRNVLDIDNDGAQETVFGFHPSTHAHDADVYFVSPGEGFDRKWPDISDSLLWEQSPYVFPNAHARCERSPCGHADLDDLLPLHSHVESGHSFAYRLRYLHVDPLIWEGSTYFLLQSFDVYNEHVSAVLRPRKHLPPEETRIFRTVLDNY